MGKILAFQSNTDRRIAVIEPSERLTSRVFRFAQGRRHVVVNSHRGLVALRFPEAWWPFVVMPSAKLTNS
jgi:hypothetical protein